MRAAVYTRISLDKSGEGAAVERQLADALHLIEMRGWRLVARRFPDTARPGEFCDNSISAKTAGKRPAFAAMIEAIERGEVDVIVSWSLDRLTRNARDRLALVEACQRHGVIVALVRGSDLDPTTPSGRMVIGILGEVAQNEIETKSDRHLAQHAQARAAGKPWGPIAAFGYADDKITIVEGEAARLRDAYAAVIEGASCRSIAAKWNADEVPTRGTAAKWSGAAIKRLLTNPRYAGIRATTVGSGNRRDLVEVGPAAWPAVVDEDVYRAARAILTDPARLSTTVRARRHLLPGIALCGRCGAPMRSYVSDRGVPGYRCSASPHLRRKAAPLDDLVTDVVLGRLAQPDARELLIDPDRADVPALRTQAMVLRARIEATHAEFVDDDTITPGQLRALLGGLQGRLDAIEDQMSTASRAPVLAALINADDVRAAWESDEFDLKRRRTVIAALVIPRVLPARKGPGFDPASVEFEWI